MISEGPVADLFTMDALSQRAHEVGEAYARYLGTPYLAEPIASFFVHTAGIHSLDAAVLAIQDDSMVGANLAAYAVADLAPQSLSAASNRTLMRQFGDAVSELNHAVVRGPRPIGMSSELINRHCVDMDLIIRGLQTGRLQSLCRIPFPPASHIAILSRVSAHA